MRVRGQKENKNKKNVAKNIEKRAKKSKCVQHEDQELQ